MTEREQQLSQTEGELAQEESALGGEIARMMVAATEFERKVKSVRAVLAEVSIGGSEDASLAKRVHGMGAPPLETEALFAKARKVRADAVEARAQANRHVREAVSAWKQQLSGLNAQILDDEKAAQRLVSKLKNEKARAAEDAQSHPTPAPLTVPPSLVPAQAQPGRPVPPPKKAVAESKRQSQRVKMQAAIDMTSDNNFFSGFSANISDGGLFIATVDYVPNGTQVDLSFSLPTGEKITATGVVRWHREVNDKDPSSFPGVGIQFTEIEDAAQLAIRSFIDQRDPLFYVD